MAAGGGGLERDFGYLMPFLDKVAAAAAGVADPAARAELQQLVTDEKARWERIRTLLSGRTVGQGPRAGGQPAAQGKPASDTQARLGSQLTVGNLRPR